MLLSHGGLHSQVAELYEELKRRISKFNMHVSEDPPPIDYTSIHRQKFILQVGDWS